MNSIRRYTINQLSKKGISEKINLPDIERSFFLKPIDLIANRINVLHILYTIQLEGDESLIFFNNLLRENEIYEYLSPSEKTIVSKKHLTKDDIIQLSWKKESLFALLWLVNKSKNHSVIENLSEIDMANFYDVIPPEVEFDSFLSSCNLANNQSICEALDFYYVLSWLAKHNKTNISNSLIRERRLALEWAISKESDWDNISLNT